MQFPFFDPSKPSISVERFSTADVRRPIGRFKFTLFRINLANHEESRAAEEGYEGDLIPAYHPPGMYKNIGLIITPIEQNPDHFRPRYSIYFDNCGEKGPFTSPEGEGCTKYGPNEAIQAIRIECGGLGDGPQHQVWYSAVLEGRRGGKRVEQTPWCRDGQWCGEPGSGKRLLALTLGFYPR
jgi:hypothetical protein